jgi:enamine deaminase RidA (YjgF/YER057c/UK114 family)
MSDRRRVSSGSPYEAEYGFSRVVRVGDRILVSGTAPIPPPGERVVDGAYAQMLRCGEIALRALTEAGGVLEDIVRTRVFIVDPADAGEVGRAHAGLFGPVRPAATMVVVAALLDPAWRVEIEVEAVVSP